MSDTTEPVDSIGYEKIIENAIRRGAVRDILSRWVQAPPPDPHHVYLTFRTDLSVVPDDLRQKYPHDMTIVLQHQYWDLIVADTGFTVTLKFSGVPRVLEVPWGALTRLYDPGVQFLLQFEAEEGCAPVAPPPAEPAPAGGNVVDLGQFRKR